MSRNTNGTGYSNGASNPGSDRLRRYDFNDSSRDTSADERSRSRGPGGYGSFGAQGVTSGVHAPSRLNRGHATRKSRDEGTWSNSRSRSRAGRLHGQAGSQVEGQSALYIGYNVHWLLRPYSQRYFATSSSSGPSWPRRHASR
jgi:exocyst complex component 4